MREEEDQVQVVQEVQVVLEVPLVLEHILTQGGDIRDILTTEARDLLGPQPGMAGTLPTQVVMVAILLIPKATHKENEALVPDLGTLLRDLPTLCPPQDLPLKRKGDSPVVMMDDQRVQNQG